MSRQITLPFDWKSASDESDFILSDANADAVRHLEHWALWPVRASLLVGPPKSGRSHLARMFTHWSHGTVIDDAESVDEQEIFHAWNAAHSSGKPLLIVADAAPPTWDIKLPDLASRLKATPVAAIGAPDEALLAAVMTKQFHDRGLQPSPGVIDYLIARLERSFAAVFEAVTRLDEKSLAEHRKVTIPLARKALGLDQTFIDES